MSQMLGTLLPATLTLTTPYHKEWVPCMATQRNPLFMRGLWLKVMYLELLFTYFVYTS